MFDDRVLPTGNMVGGRYRSKSAIACYDDSLAITPETNSPVISSGVDFELPPYASSPATFMAWKMTDESYPWTKITSSSFKN